MLINVKMPTILTFMREGNKKSVCEIVLFIPQTRIEEEPAQ